MARMLGYLNSFGMALPVVRLRRRLAIDLTRHCAPIITRDGRRAGQERRRKSRARRYGPSGRLHLVVRELARFPGSLIWRFGIGDWYWVVQGKRACQGGDLGVDKRFAVLRLAAQGLPQGRG